MALSVCNSTAARKKISNGVLAHRYFLVFEQQLTFQCFPPEHASVHYAYGASITYNRNYQHMPCASGRLDTVTTHLTQCQPMTFSRGRSVLKTGSYALQ